MSTIDPVILIEQANARANEYLAKADQAIQDLKGNGYTYYGEFISPNINNFQFPSYQPPPGDTSSMPVYEPPLAALPQKPSLADISNVTIPPPRAEPTLNLSNLFKQTPPSSNLPDFNEAEPDMHIDRLVAQMDAIATPHLQAIEIPQLTPLNLRAVPGFTIPGYVEPTKPEPLADPVDYSTAMASAYQRMLPEMQHFIDDKVTGWINQYAPEYQDWNSRLQAHVSAVLSGAEALPDQFEAALMTRARGRVERDFVAVEQGLLETYAKRGFYEPPGALVAGLHAGRLKNADALANQSTDIYIERRKSEVQHLQFILGLASANIQSVRGLAVSYAGTVANTMQQALVYATALAEQLAQEYAHLIARSNLAISLMTALNAEYETRLKAALASLDGYKLELDVAKTRKDVEIAQLQFIEAQISAEELQVKQFSALIDAIARKAATEELKLKGYEIRGDIFKKRTDAKLAEFEVYKAALSGDKYKMDGEMTKLTVFEELIKADELNLDAQIKAITATEAHNNALVEIFKSGGEVYKLDAGAAVQKFSAYAEVKKLAQEIYKTQLAGSVDIFKADMEYPKTMIDAVLREFDGRVRAFEVSGRLNVEEMRRVQTASEALAAGFSGIAQSALGAMSSVVSSASSS